MLQKFVHVTWAIHTIVESHHL